MYCGLPFFLFLVPLLCPILSLRKERRILSLSKRVRSHKQRSPIITPWSGLYFGEQAVSSRKPGLVLSETCPHLCFQAKKGRLWRLARSLRGRGSSVCAPLVCVASFYLLLSPPKQKLATHSFSAVCALGIKIHRMEEKKCPENNWNVTKCHIASLWTRRRKLRKQPHMWQ